MGINVDLIEELINDKNSKYFLIFEEKIISLSNVLISKSATPLKKPNMRGGVYFSDTASYRIKATTEDVSVISLISKTMLGPNPEFSEIKIKTQFEKNDTTFKASIFTNLTNTMESNSRIELDMVIVKTSEN